MVGIIIAFWFIADGVALRFFVSVFLPSSVPAFVVGRCVESLVLSDSFSIDVGSFASLRGLKYRALGASRGRQPAGTCSSSKGA